MLDLILRKSLPIHGVPDYHGNLFLNVGFLTKSPQFQFQLPSWALPEREKYFDVTGKLIIEWKEDF